MFSDKLYFRALAVFLLGSVLCFAEVRRFEGPGPVEIHVHADTKANMSSNLDKVFKTQFYPAISSQDGTAACCARRSTKAPTSSRSPLTMRTFVWSGRIPTCTIGCGRRCKRTSWMTASRSRPSEWWRPRRSRQQRLS